MSSNTTSQPPTGALHPSRDAVAMMQYDARKKTALIAYLLWFFVGGLGGHRFYLGRTGSAIAMLVLLVASIVLTYVLIGLFGFAILGIWVLVDAFLIPGMVTAANTRLIAQIQN